MARRKIARDFKLSAVKLVNEQGYTPREAAKSLGVDPQSVTAWVAKFTPELGQPAVSEPAQLRAQLKEAREEIRRLMMEREILKKAAVFFAKEHS